MPLGKKADMRRPGIARGLIPAAVLLVVCLVSFGVGQYVVHGVNVVERRDTAAALGAERLLSSVKDLETGQRGFLLTGSDEYLTPYNTALNRMGEEQAALQATGVDLHGLPEMVARRVTAARNGIELRRTGGLDAAVAAMSSGQGKAMMDDVRNGVATLQILAQSRLDKARRRGTTWSVATAAVSALSLAGAVAVVVAYALRRRRDQRRSAALLEAVLDNAPVGLGLLDRSLRVRHINRALAVMGDRALGVDVGQSIWDVMPQLRGTFETKLRDVVEGGRIIPNTEVSAASTARPDQVREFLVSFYPLDTDRLSGAAGETAGAGMVVADVTTRNRLERRVRESETRFRTLAESSSAIVWTTTPNGMLDGGKESWGRFTGQADAELAGMGWLDAVHEDDRASALSAWQDSVRSGLPYQVEQRLRRADGAWRVMAVHAVPVSNAEGSVREWVGMHTDITERREAEHALAAAKEAAEAANRAKSTFLANMSHELRTPLTAVIGYSEMLEEELEDLGEKDLVSDLGKIESNARHLLSLINDVLDLSKVEANRMTTYAEDADVATLVREAAGTVQSLVERKSNALDLRLGDELGSMHQDVVKVRQCLFNLISNAAKFTENGRITLSAERVARDGLDWLRFSVADTGIGMTEEQLSRLFQRFAQADESTTRQFGGTGLGLALTRAFCRLMGGDVSVDSRPGEGTTFTIELPTVMPEAAAAPDAEESPDQAASAGDVVLVVDDDAAQRDLLTRFLQREGFTVRTANDGRAGLDLARALRPRAILLDVMMPQMDGWSVLSALKADTTLADIPVIMASFVNEPGMAASLGANDYLLKPIQWDRLKDVMGRFVHAAGSVLVVDDNEDLRRQARAVLERHGWTVTEAHHGAEALEIIRNGMPQMILLDLTMPIMDGFQFLAALRRMEGGADVPVLVLSARDLSAADREKLSGADQVLRKGEIDLRQLPAALTGLAHAHAEAAGERAG